MDPKANQYFTTAEIAEICDVSIVSVGNWIRAEKLQAYRPPRGHYRVSRKDFILFLNESGMPMPRGLEDGVAIRVLVVDDVLDSGESAKQVLDEVRARGASVVKMATLQIKSYSSFHPDYYVEERFNWLFYPWMSAAEYKSMQDRLARAQ